MTTGELADERDQLVGDLGKPPVFRQEFGGKAMHRERVRRHVALGIDVAVKFPPGRDVMQQLDAGDLDDPVPVVRIEAGRLGVDHDFAHRLPLADSRAVGRPPAAGGLPMPQLGDDPPQPPVRQPRPSPVDTTKSARRRFSRSGICARRMLAKRLSVMPGRRMTRSRCTRAGAETTRT